MTTDEKYMARCLALARRGEYYVAPNPMVGAVLVAEDDTVLGEGWHRQYGGPHAEVHCIRAAKARHSAEEIRQATLYVNLEPCSHYGKTPPCSRMIIEEGIKKVAVGMTDPNPLVAGRGIQILRDAGIEVKTDILHDECRRLNKRFVCLHEKHRPYVTLKWAQTFDGFIDKKRLSAEEPALVISHVVTKQLVHKQRAENMAILVGTRTALLDNPSLKTTRWSGRNPLRILLDRSQAVPKYFKLFSDDAETLVYNNCTDWEYILNDLARRNVHSVLVEGGATVLNRILQSGIYDEIHVETAPIRISDGVKAPALSLPPIPKITLNGHQIYEIIR